MKERPILFSRPMVKAILAGTKTQTRRIIAKSNSNCASARWSDLEKERGQFADNGCLKFQDCRPEFAGCIHRVFPKWEPGDRLWVKETWATTEQSGVHPADAEAVYRATDPDWETMEGWRWRPSIFMPRRLSRITLEILSVRPERLQDITDDDAVHEGIQGEPDLDVDCRGFWVPGRPRRRFAMLWNSINGTTGPKSWAANPWVWRIEFKRVEGAPCP